MFSTRLWQEEDQIATRHSGHPPHLDCLAGRGNDAAALHGHGHRVEPALQLGAGQVAAVGCAIHLAEGCVARHRLELCVADVLDGHLG